MIAEVLLQARDENQVMFFNSKVIHSQLKDYFKAFKIITS